MNTWTFADLVTAIGNLQTSTFNPNLVAITGTGGGSIGSTITYDHSQGPFDTRWGYFNNTLSPSVNTTNIWENFNSFVTLNGPGVATGEINLFHSYFQVNAGATANQVEGYESSMQNNGSI